MAYDAILLVSFGGPDGPEDVIPFLENVLRGRPVPRSRLLEVSEHYLAHGGISPINEQNKALIKALRSRMAESDLHIPIFWGNRNWHPAIPAAIEDMQKAGVKRFLALITSAYSSYSGCRQYRENINGALENSGSALAYDKVRVWYNHPLWIKTLVDRYQAALARVPEHRRHATTTAFTAHSIPDSMSRNCNYQKQLEETCQLVADAAGIGHWKLVYQSRSGRPQDPWLAPDICDHLTSLATEGHSDVIIHPIGFISDHMEVIFDLDTEAQSLGADLGLNVIRAETAGLHPAFLDMLVELIGERLDCSLPRRAIGASGPSHATCPKNCCLPAARPPSRPPAASA